MVLCASLCNGVVFSILNSFGVLFIRLKELYGDDPDSATKASLVGSVAVGTPFFLSPVSGILADKLGIRLTVLLGSLIAAVGMLASSFLVDQGLHQRPNFQEVLHYLPCLYLLYPIKKC